MKESASAKPVFQLKEEISQCYFPESFPDPNEPNDPYLVRAIYQKLEECRPEEYRKRFDEPYVFNGGKDGSLIKNLLDDYDLPKLQDLATRFLDSTDQWVQQTGGYTIGIFASQINKLVSTRKPGLSQRKELPA